MHVSPLKKLNQFTPQSHAELKCSEATKSYSRLVLSLFLVLRHFVIFKLLYLEFIVNFVCLKFINIVYLLLFLSILAFWG